MSKPSFSPLGVASPFEQRRLFYEAMRLFVNKHFGSNRAWMPSWALVIAIRLRALAATLPHDAIVLETDAPDIAPSWLYATAAERAAGRRQGRNAPEEIPRIAQVLAGLREQPLAQLQAQVLANTLQALPRLQALLPGNTA